MRAPQVLGLFTLAISLAVVPRVGSFLVEEPRECGVNVCHKGTGPFQLDCGMTDDIIKDILFTNVGLTNGTCYITQFLDRPTLDDVNFTVVQERCEKNITTRLLEERCLGQERCIVDPVADFGESCQYSNGNVDNIQELTAFVRCGSTFDILSFVVTAVIGMIGLGVGASVSLKDFQKVIREHKRAVVVGWLSQFGFMPLYSYVMTQLLDMNIYIAVGCMLVGMSPGGSGSNLFTYYAKGSVALSITMTAASTSCALVMIPLLTLFYVKTLLKTKDYNIEIPIGNILITLGFAIVPAVIGVFIREKNKKIAAKIEKAGTMIGCVLIAAAAIIGAFENPGLMVIPRYPKSILTAFLLNPIGCAFGYIAARLARLPTAEARAISIECGIQNLPLSLALAQLSFEGCTRVKVTTFVIIALAFNIGWSVVVTLFLRFVMAPLDKTVENESVVSVVSGEL